MISKNENKLHSNQLIDSEFQNLYNQHHLKVYNYIAKIINSKEDALDILQEVFLLFYDRLNRLDTNNPRIEVWLMRVARNLSFSYNRERSRKKTQELPMNQAGKSLSSEQEFYKKEIHKRFNEFLGTLTERERTIFILHKLEQIKYKDLVLIFDTSPRTLKRIVASVIQKMKDEDLFQEEDFT